MTSRFWIAALLAVVAAVSGAAGFWLGAREGVKLGDTLGAPARGVLAVRALRDFNIESTRGAKLVLEMQVDRGLFSANELLDSLNRRIIGLILGPDTGAENTENWAIALAKYRKATPSPFQGEYLTHDPGETFEQRKLIDEATERHRESVRIIDLMIERYASK